MELSDKTTNSSNSEYQRSFIGEGSFGKIYKITSENGSLNALKYICNNEKHGIKSLIEIYIMNNLIHRSIAKSIKINIDDCGNIKIYQPIALADAAQIFRINYTILPFNLLKRISWDIIEGIGFLHSKGILHCDIKARNILCFGDLSCLSTITIKIIDFGYSLVVHDINSTYDIGDKMSYTSTHRPIEVFNKSNFSYSADIWALGCTLYEIAYGKLLFPVQNTTEEYVHCLELFESSKENNVTINGLCKKFSSAGWGEKGMEDFNYLLLLMLKLNPKHRINTWDLIKHEIFNDISNIKSISFNLSYPVYNNPIIKNYEIYDSIKFYTDNIFLINHSLYLLDIINKNDDTEITTLTIQIVINIAHKFLYNTYIPIFKKFTYRHLTEEIRLCKLLNFNLYFYG